MSISPVPNSVMISPAEGSNLSRVFYSVVTVRSWNFTCTWLLFLKQILFKFSTWKWPEMKVSWDEVELQVTLFDIFSTKKNEFRCYKMYTSILLCKYCFWYLLRCGLRSVCPEFQEEYNTFIPNLEFYISADWILQCYKLVYNLWSKTVLIVVVPTWMWPETKYPESPDM